MYLDKPLIDIRLGVDYFAVKAQLPPHKLLIFTGPIDAYYASLGLPKLEYRSLVFEQEYHEPPSGYYQEALQVRGVVGPGGTIWWRVLGLGAATRPAVCCAGSAAALLRCALMTSGHM